MPISENELKKGIDAWVRHSQLTEDSREQGKYLWAFEWMISLVENDPESAWTAIALILEMDLSDKLIAVLAAGPLEDLLVAHGAQFIDRIEQAARRDSQMRHLLGGVWRNAIPEDIWQRIEAVAGPKW